MINIQVTLQVPANPSDTYPHPQPIQTITEQRLVARILETIVLHEQERLLELQEDGPA